MRGHYAWNKRYFSNLGVVRKADGGRFVSLSQY